MPVHAVKAAAAGEEQMGRFFRPVVERMDELKGTLETIMRSAQKSQRIGELGEEIVAKQLRDAFPTDSSDVVSKDGHQADIRALIATGVGDSRGAIVEVKFYSNDVPTPEIDKFRRDLSTTGTRYGLMVSLASRMTGMKGGLQLEETSEYTAVYVPHTGLDGINLVTAAALLKAIITYHARVDTARRIPAAAIEQVWTRLYDQLEEVKAVARSQGAPRAYAAGRGCEGSWRHGKRQGQARKSVPGASRNGR